MSHEDAGRLERGEDGCQLRFQRRLAHPPERVWTALTEPGHLAAWFPVSIEGERRAGAPLQFIFPGGRGPTLDGEMLTYRPFTLIEFRWHRDRLRFELEPEGTGTVLTFIQTFDEVGRAARDASGWHLCLDALVLHLEDETAVFEFGTRWAGIHDGYVRRFGPEAASIGPPEGAQPD